MAGIHPFPVHCVGVPLPRVVEVLTIERGPLVNLIKIVPQALALGAGPHEAARGVPFVPPVA